MGEDAGRAACQAAVPVPFRMQDKVVYRVADLLPRGIPAAAGLPLSVKLPGAHAAAADAVLVVLRQAQVPAAADSAPAGGVTNPFAYRKQVAVPDTMIVHLPGKARVKEPVQRRLMLVGTRHECPFHPEPGPDAPNYWTGYAGTFARVDLPDTGPCRSYRRACRFACRSTEL